MSLNEDSGYQGYATFWQKKNKQRGFRDGEEGSGTAMSQEEQNQESEESVDGKDRNVWTKRLVWNT